MIDSQIIEGIVNRYYDVTDLDNTKYSMVFHISSIKNRNTFSYLLDELNRIGVTAFTNDYPDNQIIVIGNGNISRERNGIKIFMLLVSIATLIYSGFVYYSDYYSATMYKSILGGSLFYAIPLFSILLFREFGKYTVLRKNHIKYKFPIFIPSPGLGTLGTINSNKNQFRDSKSMIQAGTLSLLFGFFSSIFLVIAGTFIMPSANYNAGIHSPVSILNFPLLFPLVLERFFPAFILPDPLQLAGYAGIVITALNALPVGFLDGGIVFSGIMGKHFKYASYAGTAILLAASIVYPYILILVAISLILGIRGALPMNNFFRPQVSIRTLGIIVIIILVLGFAPLPLHSTNNSNVAIPDSPYIVQSANPGNVSVNVTVYNYGMNVVPTFSVNPGTFKVSDVRHVNNTATVYTLNLITYNSNYSGERNFNITVNTGTDIFHKTVSVYFLKPDKNISVDKKIEPQNLTEQAGKSFNITIDNPGNTTLKIKLILIYSNINLYMNPSNLSMISLFGHNMYLIIPPRTNATLFFQSSNPGLLKIIIIGTGNQATIVNINITSGIISPPNPFPTMFSGNNTLL
ncbi:site-2 protease family protein [Ferroplasma sp.]|uniref:site-2 protease family protein n=1 Tax=Ferroplasma sp. TaxID=2591003 RepID=UPI00307D2C41